MPLSSPVVLATLATVAAAALLSTGLILVLLPVLRQRLPDVPNTRSAHSQPIPRGGGLAFVLVGCFWGLPLIPLLCAPLALVGLIDDRRNLPARVRYLAQLATAGALLASAALTLPSGRAGVVSGLIAVVAITAVINFFNFMDGLDGLVASCSAVLFAVAALVLQATWLWPLVGGLLGFLVWNWSPARVFMGDAGSTFLGAVAAGVLLQAPTVAEALGLLLVGLPLLGDATVCVLRRLAAGQPVFQAHRLHLYQRLQQAGWSHRRVCITYLAATILIGVGVLVGGLVAGVVAAAVVLAWGVGLDSTVAVPFPTAVQLAERQGG